MAGLSAAWMISRKGFTVSVFEKGTKPGLSAHSRDFSQHFPASPSRSEGLNGDVPSRMFNDSLWPGVVKLYQEAGVKFEPVDNHQTFYRGDEILLKAGLPYAATIAKNVLNPVARRLAGSLTAFQRQGLEELKNGDAGQSFGAFIDDRFGDGRFDELFDSFLFPALTSTVFTCSKADLRNYPCHLVLEALNRISNGSDPLMRTVNGSDDAAERLLNDVNDLRFNTSVEKVLQGTGSATVIANGESFEFDHVIIATQANHASHLIAEALPQDSHLLKQFRYVNVPIVVHTDSNVLPKAKRDWATFNFDSSDSEMATCTVWMNRFHDSWPDSVDVFHSIFPSDRIDGDQILFSAVMQRPVVDDRSQQLHDELNELHLRDRRVWFVGSYASAGVPLLESAVQSSRAVVSRLSANIAATS